MVLTAGPTLSRPARSVEPRKLGAIPDLHASEVASERSRYVSLVLAKAEVPMWS